MLKKSFSFNIRQLALPILWTALILFGPSAHIAYGLKMAEQGKLLFYFPEEHTSLATDLIQASESMIDFLKDNGLKVTVPIHIVLDAELDQPQTRSYLLPHREIRIPLRAPGVLEEGYDEAFPWRYFLFKGLCIQSMYNERSGIPDALYGLFGELITPNRVLPEWFFDSVAFLLYEKYQNRKTEMPLSESIFNSCPLPDLDFVSNHPEVWPGHYSYSIYGRPFVRWLIEHYGWDKVLAVLQLHGQGIVPIEIDLEALEVFNKTWDQLWQAFKKEHSKETIDGPGKYITGYWYKPFVYWNEAGIQPGPQTKAERSRYGFMDNTGRLWLSSYDSKGVSRLTAYKGSNTKILRRKHVWDPGPGGVAVTRRGHKPYLILAAKSATSDYFNPAKERLVEAPVGVIQLSGPVADDKGRVAVAGNTAGNWDIWIYDGQWHRITTSPSIEMDPWIENDILLFASNISGRFQIHDYNTIQLTRSDTAAVLPRHQSYAQLNCYGWQISHLSPEGLTKIPDNLPPQIIAAPAITSEEKLTFQNYKPLKSLWPNYIAPDLFIDTDDFQIGLFTSALDVTGEYGWDTGVRYSFDDSDYSWRLGGQAHSMIARATRYPFSYTTERLRSVNETRHDIKIGWSLDAIGKMEISANWRHYEPVDTRLKSDEEWWGALLFHHLSNNWQVNTYLDLFTENSQSLYGLVSHKFGQRIYTVAQLYAGKTWGDLKVGHNTFRIGGNSGEGFFTYRPSRLFPLRGFDANIIDAGHAAVASVETYWPLAQLQAGYKTLPLFLRNINIGTFVDGGFAANQYSEDELLVGAGFEIITGMEFAWGVLADFRIGIAWPIHRPDDLNGNTPVILIQIGKPL